MMQNLITRDVSGGHPQLLYELEMPLEMLTQTLQQHFSDDVQDYPVD
jgi:hypothetical protein